MTQTRLRRLLTAWPAGLTMACLVLCALELGGRLVLRQSILQNLGVASPPSPGAILAVAGAAAVAGLLWLRRRHEATMSRMVALGLALLFLVGLAAQRELGTRLQSDGFYYFAFLRSAVNDHDVNLANDYRLIGVGRPELFAPTPTGYAQTAWSVGPAIAWSPFYAVGSVAARYRAASGAAVALDGSSYPYRQAVCIAGLFYGLLGFWFCYRLAARFFPHGIAAMAMAAMGFGSFMLWYIVKEPSMSHATSMCVVAGYVYAWAVTRDRRTAWQWAALGLLGGLMLAVRWQNLIFMVFPAWEAAAQLVAGPGRRERRAVLIHAGLFAACAFVGFLPQLLAWNAIYGSPLAVSPLSPRMIWWNPQIVLTLWSSRNGLFATSPIIYLAAIGLVVWAFRNRRFGWLVLAVFGLAVYVNASVEDWWGGAAYSARRFDGTIPLLVLGLSASIETLKDWLARRPLAAVAALLGVLVLWNVTAMATALAGRFGGSVPQSFTELAVDQAHTLNRWIGHPFSYPANLIYALREGVAPFRYDYFAFPMIGDPAQPYGRIDVGAHDEAYLADGWYGAETQPDGTTFRWSSSTAEFLVPLDHAAPLVVQLRVKPFSYPDAALNLAVRVNGRSFGPFPLTADWQRVDFPTEASAWSSGVNRVQLLWLNAAVPARVGIGSDDRELGGATDYLRIQVPR